MKEISELRLGTDVINAKVMEELFKTHYLQLCNYAYVFLKDVDESEDVVQGVFYQIWKNRATTEITTALNFYLFTAVRNNCLKKLNHWKIKNQYKENIIHRGDKGSNNIMDEIKSKELEKQIKNAIESLPQQCRLVFTLSRQSGLKYAQIAEHLGISIKTVEHQMGKALKVLREKLKNYLNPTL